MNEILKVIVVSAVLAIPISLIDYKIAENLVFKIADFLHYQLLKK